MTGKSVPVSKETRSIVYAGSINANGELRVKITRTAADNTIARIIPMVEEAQGPRKRHGSLHRPLQPLVHASGHDRVGARRSAPPSRVLRRLVHLDLSRAGGAPNRPSCTCNLNPQPQSRRDLASGARRGLLVKGGAALETLGKVRIVAFDKTGTCDRRTPAGHKHCRDRRHEAEMLAKAAAVERCSDPLGMAIVVEAESRGLDIPKGLAAWPYSHRPARRARPAASPASSRWDRLETPLKRVTCRRRSRSRSKGWKYRARLLLLAAKASVSSD